MDKLISWAGREVLINPIAQAIPTYIMSLFKLPNGLCHTIQSTITRFWWGHKHEDRKIHWISAPHLCKSKDDGDLGFRNMEVFNEALLAKQVWRILKDENLLVARLLWAKYYPDGNLLAASIGSRPRFTWRCLIGAHHVIIRGSRWLIGDERILNVWEDRRLPRPHSFKPITAKFAELATLTVSRDGRGAGSGARIAIPVSIPIFKSHPHTHTHTHRIFKIYPHTHTHRVFRVFGFYSGIYKI